MRKFLVAVALAVAIGGCESAWEMGYGDTFWAPNNGTAALYIVRGVAPEGSPPINITMGMTPVGSLTSQTWMRFDAPPDLYDLRAYGPQDNSELIITVLPGESRFLLALPTSSGGAQLVEIKQADGRRLVREGTRTAQLNYYR
jgi:hypothetical protein